MIAAVPPGGHFWITRYDAARPSYLPIRHYCQTGTTLRLATLTAHNSLNKEETQSVNLCSVVMPNPRSIQEFWKSSTRLELVKRKKLKPEMKMRFSTNKNLYALFQHKWSTKKLLQNCHLDHRNTHISFT